MPKVSIIVVNYNYARYLDERIQSFLNQTYQDFELILIDNGSTDNSAQIINQYKEDKRVRVELFSDNIHPFLRWNRAVESIKSEYIVIAAADDSCDPRLLEKLVEKLDANPSVGLAFAQSWEVDSHGKRLRSCKETTDHLDLERWSQDFIDKGINECQYLFLQCTIPNPSGALLRREIFDQAGRLSTQMRMCSDWLLWAKMLTISDIAFVAEPLNYYRESTGGISLRQSVEGSIRETEETLKVLLYFREAGIPSPNNFCEKKYYPLLRDWLKMLSFKHPSFRANLRILRLFQRMGLRTNYQLLKYIISEVLQRKVSNTYRKIPSFKREHEHTADLSQ
ncbi:glycosyltransferase [Leptothermofonsia sichuanensis E412]|uniref:glycosyltransferase family 2 protein n=1 Tax=Leptothermofonsia sichuanensis TaxID=2917832 RepID=UPI001CA70087|nr:glycosyltransferase [Leptothermofonsia sichuanensis]QZZ22108.1 glycosyltransferase [Leptothermofonsia sichuanensis E412]